MMAVIRRNNSEWRKLVAECESSGMTQQEWCLTNNINYYTYIDRARRLRRMDEEGTDGPMFCPKARNVWVEVCKPIQEMPDDAEEYSPAESQLEQCVAEIRITLGTFTVSVTDNFNEATFCRVMTALSRLDVTWKEAAP